MKDDYKLGSNIHPTNDYIYSYIDPIYAIINSINFNGELEKEFKNNKVSLRVKKYEKM